MDKKAILEEVKKLIAAGSVCPEAKKAGEDYLASTGTAEEKKAAEALIKELKEVCLLDQVYVRAEDGKQTVGQYVESVKKAENAEISLEGFVRYETGEGLEKKQENFAEEVAAQMGK